MEIYFTNHVKIMLFCCPASLLFSNFYSSRVVVIPQYSLLARGPERFNYSDLKIIYSLFNTSHLRDSV